MPVAPVDPTNEASAAPPCEPALVEEVLRALDKAVRARQLYLGNNPTYLRAVETVRVALRAVWAETDTVLLQVEEAAFLWEGRTVFSAAEKGADALPWLCYKDGIRELQLRPGFEDEELLRFIDLVPRVRRGGAGDEDLVALLWMQEFQCFAYRAVDVDDGAELGGPGADAGRWLVSPDGSAPEGPAAAVAEARQEASATPSGIVSMADFDSALYSIDEGELAAVKRDLEAEYALDLRRLVLDQLFDTFELNIDADMRSELLDVLEQMLLHVLASGRFDLVAYLIREARVLAERARDVSAADRARLTELPARLSRADTVRQLLQQLEDAAVLPSEADLAELFGQLRPSALETVLGGVARARTVQLQGLLATAADRLASSSTADLVALIGHADPDVSREAMRRAGALRTPAAVAPLARSLAALVGGDRLVAVQALAAIASPGALQQLEGLLGDADRDVRITVVRTLAARGQRGALPRLEAMLKGRELRTADLSERMAVYEAYGTLAGDSGVALLDGVLNPKGGLLGRREDAQTRACAALGLGRIASDAARRALERAANDKDAVVRNAVGKALRGAE
jgi:HEAT repeat protein